MGVHIVSRVIELVDLFYLPIGARFGKGRQFGCLALRGPIGQPNPLRATVPFGVISADSGCYDFAPEKVNRLALHGDHWSSFQSRDPDAQKWGGAIRIPEETRTTIEFMAWSSYPERVDEAFMLAVASKLQLMTFDDALRIATLSDNEFLVPIVQLMG